MSNVFKKPIFLLLLTVLMFSFAACSGEVEQREKLETNSDSLQSMSQELSTQAKLPEGIFENASLVRPLSVGQRVKDFSVKTAEGESVIISPSSFTKPVVLTFFRGGWCPYCNRHLSEMRTTEAELLAKGFDVWFVSIDKPELLYESLKEPDIAYTLYSDSELNATKTFGIGFVVDEETIKKYVGFGIDLEKASGKAHHVLPAPSTFIIGAGGNVHFQYTNPDYKVRLAPKDLLRAANEYVDSH